MADGKVIFETILDKAGFENGLSGLASKASSAVGAVGKVASAAVAAGAAGVAALTKGALNAYADYEQLVGGVETLFKTSSDQVMKYAENAYITTGLSANQYMETVTGFSASLIQSLGGDTAKAAEYAQTAMVDMSDNANKMGTDMQSIQYAYQGFAKQNYTMLDNLKLGYGGTKEEMARLISDASKMTDVQAELNTEVKDGDMSFANIVNAIHVVQGSLGILGTTEKEAATTIQGSLNMTKASWQNLLTALGDPDGDVEGAVQKFIDSFSTLAANALPIIEAALYGIAEMLQSFLPLIAERLPPLIAELLPVLVDAIVTLVQALVESIPVLMEPLIAAIPQVAQVLLEGLNQILPILLPAIIQILLEIIVAIIEFLPGLIDSLVACIPGLIQAICEGLLAHIPDIIMAGINLLMALIQAIPTIIRALVDNLPLIISTIITTLLEHLPELIMGAVQLFMALIIAIPQIMVELVRAIPQIITGIVQGLSNGFPRMLEVGKNLIIGLWNGIAGMGQWLWDKIKEFANNMVDGFLKFFHIGSPSKLMRDKIGVHLPEGLVVGWEKFDFPEKIGKVLDKDFGSLQEMFFVNNAQTASGFLNSQGNIMAQTYLPAAAQTDKIGVGADVFNFNIYGDVNDEQRLYQKVHQTATYGMENSFGSS